MNEIIRMYLANIKREDKGGCGAENRWLGKGKKEEMRGKNGEIKGVRANVVCTINECK